MRYTLLSALLITSSLVAEEAIIRSSNGASHVITIDPELPLSHLIEQVSALEDSKGVISLELLFDQQQIIMGSSHVKGIPRNYFSSLGAKEKEDITYILRTLANYSLVKLSGHKTALKKAGDRIQHVHPFRFLMFVFTNDELIVCMRNLQNKGFIWKEVLDGVVSSLHEEEDLGNLKPEYIQQLAFETKVDPNAIIPSIQGRRYEELIQILIALVPRNGNSGRYDM